MNDKLDAFMRANRPALPPTAKVGSRRRPGWAWGLGVGLATASLLVFLSRPAPVDPTAYELVQGLDWETLSQETVEEWEGELELLAAAD